MTHSISSVPARVAIVLAVTTIVLTAVVGAGGVAAESASAPASTATEVEITPDRAAPVSESVTAESPGGAAGIAAATTDGAEITLSVVEETEDSITVSLATSAADTMAYAAGLSYDEDVVTVESIDGADFDAPVTNVSEGTVRLTQSRLPEAAVDEPELATITFTAAGAGETSLSFDEAETIVETPDGEVTPLETQGLTLSVGDEGGGGPIGGAPGDGSDDASATPTDRASTANGTDNATASETDGRSTESEAGDGETGATPEQDDGASSPVPGFTPLGAVLALLGALIGSAARDGRSD